MSEPVYRIPPYRFDGEVLTANQMKDVVDWGLLANKIPQAWKKSRGRGILVGIIDTGTAIHTDLPNPEFDINMSNSGTSRDRQGHATHVAGTIGARANDRGVVGVAPECAIGYIKGLGDDGSGFQESLANAIRRCVTEGCHIINMSWGGGFSRVIEEAVRYAESKGVLCVVAAGNDGYQGNNTVNHPASSISTIAITSYNKEGKISDWSSGGEEVDLAFPGENILSTWPGNRYNRISGTSMATPFAVGVAALAMSAYMERNSEWLPTLRAERVREIIRETAQDKGPQGKDDRWGWGVVDIDKVVGWKEVVNEPIEQVKIGPYLVKFDGKDLTISQNVV